MEPSKVQPALLGGVAIGVLSALPLVNTLNVCCCAWVLFGGALAAYLMQQNHPAPVSTGDGALVGLMAGGVGAVVTSLLSIPMSLAMGPFQARILEQVLNRSAEMPPEVRSFLEQLQGSIGGGALIGVGFILSLIFSLVLFSIFGLIGGILGAVMFRKNVPPPPPPPQGFTPGSFTPPSSFSPPPPLPGPPPGGRE
ncbi:MAG: hypothetical protein ACT4QD_07925 [Acidobacteriota bacterium]